MLLEKLIKNHQSIRKRVKIKGLAIDSKRVKKGYIFFAIKGNRVNGEKFINEALRNGASVIICSKNCKFKKKNTIIIRTLNVRNLLSEISSKFYKLKPKNIIAVTGTNGKTSVADMFYQILNLNNIPVASIGTLGIKLKNKLIKSKLTSPDTITLHQTLEKLKEKKIDNVIIETSSHGLHQKRVNHVNFKAGIFTNFSQDHLDYHKTMNSYFESKMLLFKKIMSKGKKIISDSNLKEFPILKKISKKKQLPLIDINEIKKKIYEEINLNMNEFQIRNLSMAVAAAKICNLKEKKIFKLLPKIKDVNGRLELIKIFSNNIKVYVDFAHTPDALNKSIKALRDKHKEEISLVFGCGGDRDYKKRPLMAKIASSNCKKIYVTDDNPRNENPKKIRSVILKNIVNKNSYNIGERSRAIKAAILNAEPNEVILVAGKGHETDQIFKNKIISISDKQIINNIRLKIKKKSTKDQNFDQNRKILRDLAIHSNVRNFHGLSIDSRTVKKDNLFLTIKGKNNDGFKFINEALRKGAKFVVSSKKNKKYRKQIIKVNDEIKFLNHFALKKRDYSKAKIIAITGSAGKTSLKNLIKNLLENFGKTLSSPKSYNNHFGVPLSLAQLGLTHKYGVFEIGMSKAGEINTLSKIIKPNTGIITNIGEAHIENFDNLKGIAKAKSEIINNIQKNGTIILNRDDKFFKYLCRKAKLKNLKIVSFGKNKKSDIFPVFVKKREKKYLMKVRVKDKFFNLEFKNINIYNILSSLALLNDLNLNIAKITNLFKGYEPSEGRGKLHKIKRYKKVFKLIDESYNANPLSVKMAIQNFNSIKKLNFKKYLLLGEMLELGKKSEMFHKNLSKVINNSDIDKVFVKGTKTLSTYKNIREEKRGNIFQQDEDIDFTLNNIIANNDYLMIKGSNATGLNKLSKKMIKGY